MNKTHLSIRLVALGAFALLATLPGCAFAQSQTEPRKENRVALSEKSTTVIEVVTFKLNPGVSIDEFRPLDKAVEMQHVAKQPGFVSRESAAGGDGEWLVIVHWRSVEDAEASMAIFATAAPTEKFMSALDATSMVMKRYVAN